MDIKNIGLPEVNILTYLNQLAGIIFEPVLVLTLGGIALALTRKYRRRNPFFYPVAIGLGFMLCWRGLVRLLSARYSEILIFGAIVFAAYFIALFPEWFFCKFRNSRVSVFLRGNFRTASRLLLLTAVIFCIGKFCGYNRFDRALPDMCQKVKNAAAEYDRVQFIEFCKDSSRVSFYLEHPVISLDMARPRQENLAKLRRLLHDGPPVSFVLCREKRGENLSASAVGADAHEWSMIYSSPRNNRKNSFFNVYRYIKSDEK